MRASSITNAILKVLEDQEDHLTAKEVYEKVKGTLSAVDPSTVYRSLERMVHQGQVSVSDMGGPAVVYELVAKEPHHHLVCEKCGKVLTFQRGEMHDFLNRVHAKSGYQITTNHLVLFGICPDCQKKNDP
ncbi:MAG TPA: transcriptional repressor [Anaerolineaceae bacterium]|jgi:Fe2+ or Zn2+ uptake regulation protein|nr:transcriptional repressor [Anaerolineaceae bacterium]